MLVCVPASVSFSPSLQTNEPAIVTPSTLTAPLCSILSVISSPYVTVATVGHTNVAVTIWIVTSESSVLAI